jgi:restriction system protein
MIPRFYEMFKPMLEFLKDGKVHSMVEVKEYIANYFNLSEEEKNEMLPGGSETRLNNRVYWARTYLVKAGLVEIPERGKTKITERGLKVLEENPSVIDVKFLFKFPEFKQFQAKSKEKENSGTPQGGRDETEKSPEEIIEEKITEINEAIKGELLDKILKLPPQFFERLVLDLIVKMGYGGSFEEASKLLGKVGDEGVDGVIKEDLLGLDNVYLQAKRWSKDTVIGRPEIQKFVGALHGKGAKKGIFITTAKFSSDAFDYAESIKDMKIILIDGDKLLDYMLKYNVGVETKRTIEIKKIDEGYFEEY